MKQEQDKVPLTDRRPVCTDLFKKNHVPHVVESEGIPQLLFDENNVNYQIIK